MEPIRINDKEYTMKQIIKAVEYYEKTLKKNNKNSKNRYIEDKDFRERKKEIAKNWYRRKKLKKEEKEIQDLINATSSL